MANTRKSSRSAPRGFARDPQAASRAGRKAHEMGAAHEFSSEEAREAGRKGGRN